jgi:acetate kinase
MYVAHKGAELLGRDIGELKIITCHLGNGASITAVQSGKSVDTSMGFTPAEGLLMGTRAGDMDPAVPLFIMNKTGINITDMDNIINKRSGLLGVSGVSNDMRDIISSMEKGNERAKLAFDIYCYRVKKYIGAYAAALGGVDLIVFTAGIGENNPFVREHCCRNLEFLGVEIDPQLNAEMVGKNGLISKPTSRVKVAVIRTNEELVIVKETLRILKESNLI